MNAQLKRSIELATEANQQLDEQYVELAETTLAYNEKSKLINNKIALLRAKLSAALEMAAQFQTP